MSTGAAKKTGKKRGPKPHRPTKANREAAKTMAAAGCTRAVIAGCLGISLDVLDKHYKAETAGGKSGMRPHEPTRQSREHAKLMAAMGIPQDKIAKRLEISPMTLRQYYRHELDVGKVDMLTQVGGSLFKKAMGDSRGSVSAAIFILKTQGGWKETDRLEMTGADGGPIETQAFTARDRIASRIAGLAQTEPAS